MQKHWNPELLRSLTADAGLTMKQLSSILELSPATVSQWMSQKSVPTIDTLVRLADLFGVSLDFLCGRCTKEESDEIRKDFKRYFKNRTNEAFMRYLEIPNKTALVPPGVDAPWPYNLLDEVFGEVWTDLLTPMQQEGLDYALGTLTDRERDMILLYYESGLPFNKIGEQCNLTTERVRQIIHKAIRKLRYPTRSKPIKLGYDRAAHEPEIEDWTARLNALQRQLEQREADLKAKEAFIEERSQRVARQAQELGVETILDPVVRYANTSIEELQLSVRAFNVLHKARINTVADVIKNAARLSDLRNMGRGTLQEVVQKVFDFTGVNLEASSK